MHPARWRSALAALMLGGAALVPPCETVPVTGRSQLQLVSPTQEAPEFLSTHLSEETRIRQIDAWLPGALRYSNPPR